MTHEPLSALWALRTPSAPPYPTPPPPHITLLNDLLLSRFSAHHLCTLLPSVPSTHARLRAVLDSLYTWLVNFTSHLSTLLTASGHPPPPLPRLSAAPSEEASLSTADLAATVASLMAPEVAEVVTYMCYPRDGYHWASKLAPMVVASEVVIAAMGKKGSGEMGGFFETMGGEVDMSGFMALMGEYVSLAGMVGEELAAVRASPHSGWRDAEARDLAEGYLSRYRKFFVV